MYFSFYDFSKISFIPVRKKYKNNLTAFKYSSYNILTYINLETLTCQLLTMSRASKIFINFNQNVPNNLFQVDINANTLYGIQIIGRVLLLQALVQLKFYNFEELSTIQYQLCPVYTINYFLLSNINRKILIYLSFKCISWIQICMQNSGKKTVIIFQNMRTDL